VVVLAIGFGAPQTGVAVAEDLATGVIDRFGSLPIASAWVLAGRVTADAVRNLFAAGLMIAVGSAIGFRFHAGPAAALGAVTLAVAAGIAFSWLNLLPGIVVRDAETAGLAGLFPVIILTFTSSTLVPVATMPGWLQAFAKINLITVMVGALEPCAPAGPPPGRSARHQHGPAAFSSPPSPRLSAATATQHLPETDANARSCHDCRPSPQPTRSMVLQNDLSSAPQTVSQPAGTGVHTGGTVRAGAQAPSDVA
jgi:ABC-2 type transporter